VEGDEYRYRFIVAAEDQAAAGRGAEALADALREVEGVLDANRGKADEATMDLGTIVTVVATSAATVAIAKGLAAWLQARRGGSVTVWRDGKTGSVKAVAEGIDPEAAVRITEIVREG